MTAALREECLAALRGAGLDGLQYGAEEDTWYFLFSAAVLRVECAWRFARADGSVFGPGDLEFLAPPGGTEELPAELRPFLEGAVVTEVQVSESGDLRLEFSGAAHLAVLCNKRMYENWVLDLPGGRFLLAGPGGGLVVGER